MDLTSAHLRIARPTADLPTIERFWIDGVGLDLLWRSDADAQGGHALTMIGPANGAWHLELVADADAAAGAEPTEEDLLVLYLGRPAEAALQERIGRSGGQRVTARNPYWEEWGVTFADPDGYRLVLSERTWP